MIDILEVKFFKIHSCFICNLNWRVWGLHCCVLCFTKSQTFSVWDRFGLKAGQTSPCTCCYNTSRKWLVLLHHWKPLIPEGDRRSRPFSPFCAIIAPVYLNLLIPLWMVDGEIAKFLVLRNVLKLLDSLLWCGEVANFAPSLLVNLSYPITNVLNRCFRSVPRLSQCSHPNLFETCCWNQILE